MSFLLLTLLWACDGPARDALPSPAPRARAAVAGELCVNEVMPDNEAAHLDELGGADDWIELHNPGSEDLSLAGWSISDDRTDPRQHLLSEELVVPAGGFLVLWADAQTSQGPTHLPFSLSSDGEEVGLYDGAGDGAVLAFGAVQPDFSVARRTDCCTAGDGDGDDSCLTWDFRGTPGSTNAPPETAWETVLPLGGTWRYLDRGGDTAPTDWTSPDFRDRDWSEGAAPLGYGDSHQVTTVSYGGGPNDKHPTTWFRASFTLSDLAGVTEARVRLLRDDGAAVHLNGTEVGRMNLPAGELTATTWARAAVGGADETAVWTLPVDLGLLVEGENVVAVEVHQAAPTSSDLGFDLGVEVARPVD